MTLPKDPYEITTQQLIDADRVELQKIQAVLTRAKELNDRLEVRIAAYGQTLEGYRNYRRSSGGTQQVRAADPYADDAKVARELQGLTNTTQRLIKLGLMDNRRVKLAEAGRVMHRIGIMGGKWKNVPARLYATVKNEPEIFEWIESRPLAGGGDE